MKRLWAPWRFAYIKGEREEGCLFCRVAAEAKDEENLVLLRGERAFVMMNLYPYNNGHLLFAPYRHVASFADLAPEEASELLGHVGRLEAALTSEIAPHGFNAGANLGAAAGAGVPGHLHLHLVPRWNGDTNFMPVVGETKVIPEALDTLAERLRKAIADARGARG